MNFLEKNVSAWWRQGITRMKVEAQQLVHNEDFTLLSLCEPQRAFDTKRVSLWWVIINKTSLHGIFSRCSAQLIHFNDLTFQYSSKFQFHKFMEIFIWTTFTHRHFPSNRSRRDGSHPPRDPLGSPRIVHTRMCGQAFVVWLAAYICK